MSGGCTEGTKSCLSRNGGKVYHSSSYTAENKKGNKNKEELSDNYCLNKAFLASSPAFLALVTDGLVRLFLTLPFPALPPAFALTTLAAATTLSRFPPLGRLCVP